MSPLPFDEPHYLKKWAMPPGISVLWGSIVPILLLLFAIVQSHAGELEPARIPSLNAALRMPAELRFCGEPVPLEDVEARERLEKELLLTLWNRPQVMLWLKRSSRYLPVVKTMLREAELPEDLVYMPIVESALLPYAVSHKRAVGFWQFTAGTGRKYGLTIDSGKDERRNLKASTRAAIRYLKALYQIFGSWALAVAAYNMGEEGLLGEIEQQETSDYYRLYLPVETQRFVFRILAVKLIMADPALYGFLLEPEDRYFPLKTEEIKIRTRKRIPIQVVAVAAGTDFKKIKDLNPQLRGHYLDKGRHTLELPKEGTEGFQKRFKLLEKRYLSEAVTYVVRKGDNLTAIAEKYDVSLNALLRANRLNPSKAIHPGQVLQIP